MKNSESFNSRLNQAGQKKQTAWTQVIWNYSVIKPKRNCKKRKKKVLWDIIKGTNVCIMGLSERADKDKESDSLLKKKKKWQHIPKYGEGNERPDPLGCYNPNGLNIKRALMKHIIIKLTKVKHRNCSKHYEKSQLSQTRETPHD